MAKGNAKRFVVVSGSEKYSKCPQVDTAGEKLPMKHLIQEVYSQNDDACRKCGVCAAFLKSKMLPPNVVPITSARGKVRPHGWNATHNKIKGRVSAGLP